jgi:type VI secretion system protein VasJ
MGVDEALTESRTRIAPLLEPVAGGVGEDISYDPQFEAIKAEIDKLQSLEGAKVDWSLVVANCEELLVDKSKDFRTACYFAAAKPHTDNYAGLLDGLVLMKELCAVFWEPMYPPIRRLKARGNLLSWYADVTGPFYAESAPGLADRAVVLAADQISREVDSDMRERMGDDYQGITALRDALRELVRKLPPEPVAAPPPQAAAPAPTPSAGTGAAAASSSALAAPNPAPIVVAWPKSFDDASAATTAASEISLCMSKVAEALREADPADADAYRYGRIGAWMLAPSLPENEGGTTSMRAPPEALRESLTSLQRSEEWLDLLREADQAVSDFVFWLDANRYLAVAMDNLGAKFIKARKALLWEVAIFVARIPEIVHLTFEDGTPFADGATKMWIESEVQGLVSNGGGARSGGGGASFLDQPLAEARSKAAAGQLEEALAVLQSAAGQAPSRADRFRAELAMAKLTLGSDRFEVARSHLSALEQHVLGHRLQEWDPRLAAEFYQALYEAARGENALVEEPSPEAHKREQNAFEWLCLLDPAAAVRLRS